MPPLCATSSLGAASSTRLQIDEAEPPQARYEARSWQFTRRGCSPPDAGGSACASEKLALWTYNDAYKTCATAADCLIRRAPCGEGAEYCDGSFYLPFILSTFHLGAGHCPTNGKLVGTLPGSRPPLPTLPDVVLPLKTPLRLTLTS
jgi:hypothetical protein